jgi:hypothetical protein
MPDLSSFLDELSTVTISNVVLDGNEDSTPASRVFVGCGRWPATNLPLTLVLENKGAYPRWGRHYSSVAQMLANPPEGLFDSWELWSQRPLHAAAALDRFTMVVEDASPDSVIAVVLLLARLFGVEPPDFPVDWINAADYWEREGVADDPWTSWCALASALAHSQFPRIGELSTYVLARAWTNTLHFAATCLQRGLSPYAIPSLPDIREWREAQAALHQEERVYLDWLPHATSIQLSLPLAAAPDRRLLIDGLLVVEDQPTGSAKLFYRNDRVRSPLKEGFGFAAHYRPAEQGTGNDITIAVDPRLGVHLRELWRELEQQEKEAWSKAGLTRPNDHVRYLEGVESKWNEPWFITPNGTLIGAPRRLSEDVYGTMLTWRDILDTIWTVFNPLREVKVCAAGSNMPILLADLKGEDRPAEHHKKLLLASWPRLSPEMGGAGPPSLTKAPVVSRVFAGMIPHNDSRRYRSALADLPPSGSWEEVRLSGGFAVVTQNGALILDDWTEERLDFSQIREAFHNAASLDHGIRRLELDEVRPLLAQVRLALTRRRAWREAERVLRRVARMAAQLAELRGNYATIPHGPDARKIRDAVDKEWGLDRRLAALEGEIKSIEGALRSLSELRTLGISRFAVIYAFPVILATGIADPLAKTVWALFGMRVADSESPSWLMLVCFVLAALGTGLLMWALLSREDPFVDSDQG